MALPYSKRAMFWYIKLYWMCKLIVGYASVRFRPFRKKVCVWLDNFYKILFSVKQSVIGLVALIANASAWYKGVGRSLRYLKSLFYSMFKFSYGAKLINRIGLTAQARERKLMARSALCNLDALGVCSATQFCFASGRVFKLCSHSLISATEFKFVELNKLTSFSRLKPSSLKLVLRCTSNHTKRAVRAVISGALLGGAMLWDLGSGSGSLSLCWIARGGVNAICFENNKLSLKLNAYNARLVSRTRNTLQLIGLCYELGLLGVSLPDRLFFGCGLKQLRSWRCALVHLKFKGRAVAVSVSSSGDMCISLLNSKYATNSYLLIVRKLKLKLNTKLYALCSSVLVCVILKTGGNIW
ncbi:MAG: hypothetical protein AAI946_00340 [Candidatus Hodgkinia cicadicola]